MCGHVTPMLLAKGKFEFLLKKDLGDFMNSSQVVIMIILEM